MLFGIWLFILSVISIALSLTWRQFTAEGLFGHDFGVTRTSLYVRSVNDLVHVSSFVLFGSECIAALYFEAAEVSCEV